MQKFIIKTHKPGTTYQTPHFYILNKGMNSGKPLKTACPNCFALEFHKESDTEKYFYMALSLWQSHYWHRHLVGSVIPFIRIEDFKKEFERKCERMLLDYREHQNQIKALRLLEERESYHKEKLALSKEMRNVVLLWYAK